MLQSYKYPVNCCGLKRFLAKMILCHNYTYFCSRMMEFLHSVLGPDIEAALLIILNLIIIESLLSVDNAAVLATMVMDLPEHQRGKALKYGIIGAYFFRGICLLFAAWLIHIWWLKPIGGFYLLYLALSYFLRKKRHEEAEKIDKKKSKLYHLTVGKLGPFWSTILLVELMDLAFSLDNVFAAVAYVENYPQPQGLYLVWIGVFIGILAMRFVAQGFVKLMQRFPILETSAFIVIGILGLKLSASLITHFFPESTFTKLIDGEGADMYVSLLTVLVFIVPVFSILILSAFKRKS